MNRGRNEQADLGTEDPASTDDAPNARGRRHRVGQGKAWFPAADDGSARTRETEAPPPSAVGPPPTAGTSLVVPRRESNEVLRSALWDLVRQTFFVATDPALHAALERVWAAPPLLGDTLPDDADNVLEGWFSLVEMSDLLVFLEAARDALDPVHAQRFVQLLQIVLDRGQADVRVVLGRIVPITARADIAVIERALSNMRSGGGQVERHLVEALDRLAVKPAPEARGAIQATVRAIEHAAFALTWARPLGLDEVLDDLEAGGHLDATSRAAYGSVLLHAAGRQRPSADDARLLLVMASSLITQLASRLPTQPPPPL